MFVHDQAEHYFCSLFGTQKDLRNPSFLPQLLGICKARNISVVAHISQLKALPILNIKFGVFNMPVPGYTYADSCTVPDKTPFCEYEDWMLAMKSGFSDMIVHHLVPRILSKSSVIQENVLCCLLRVLSCQRYNKQLHPHRDAVSEAILALPKTLVVPHSSTNSANAFQDCFYTAVHKSIKRLVPELSLLSPSVGAALKKLLLAIPHPRRVLQRFFRRRQNSHFQTTEGLQDEAHVIEWVLTQIPSFLTDLQLKSLFINHESLKLVALCPSLMTLPYDRTNKQTSILNLCIDEHGRFQWPIDLLQSPFFVMPQDPVTICAMGSLFHHWKNYVGFSCLWENFIPKIPPTVLPTLPLGKWIAEAGEFSLVCVTQTTVTHLPLNQWSDCSVIIDKVFNSGIKEPVQREFFQKFCNELWRQPHVFKALENVVNKKIKNGRQCMTRMAKFLEKFVNKHKSKLT